MIYDKNQFTFNLIFVFLIAFSLTANYFLVRSVVNMRDNLADINKTLAKIESNQNFNFIQAPHNKVEYELLPTGFFIKDAEFGLFNGPSMQPTIFDGNIVIEKKYNNEKLEEGQIIRFLRNNKTAVIHRVRADYGDKVYVQGDSLKEGEIIDKKYITHVIVGVLFT